MTEQMQPRQLWRHEQRLQSWSEALIRVDQQDGHPGLDPFKKDMQALHRSIRNEYLSGIAWKDLQVVESRLRH